jgi:arsenate reductase
VLAEHQVPLGTPRSKRWDEFALADGSSGGMDIVITVCDNAAGELCPVWPGAPVTAHWGIRDPAGAAADDAVGRAAFLQAFEALRHRIQALVSLPVEQLERRALKRRLDEIGAHPVTAQAS